MGKKDQANKGWIKELGSKSKTEPKKQFSYSKPVSTSSKPNSMALNHRIREFKSVPQDKTTNFNEEIKRGKK